MTISAESKEKASEAERRFRNWMDRHRIPYWYIRQDLETFSTALRRFFEGKRPDYMVLLPNFGFILVDVKYRVLNKHQAFTLGVQEVASHSNLQRHFGLQVWYAISNEQVAYQTWYWAHVAKVLEIGKTEKFQNKDSGEEFFGIPASEFIQLADSDGLDRLFAKCLSS
jgi:hypothetical protein